MKKVWVLGIGPGEEDYLLPLAKRRAEEAEVLVGGKRALDLLAGPGQETKEIKGSLALIVDYIKEKKQNQQVAVLLSGDPGLYGMLNYLKKNFAAEELEVVPGISAMQMCFARLKLPWQDIKIVSLHGRSRENLLRWVKEYPKLAFFTDDKLSPQEIGAYLQANGIRKRRVVIAENLSYPDERIVETDLNGLAAQPGFQNAVMLIMQEENEADFWPYVTPGVPDDLFIRGDVPMTKEEVRAVTLAKLRLKRDSRVYDLGAGTGSISVEAALLAPLGQIVAVERHAKGVKLIEQNKARFGLANLTAVEGEAGAVLAGLPEADRIVIGGSGGHLAKMLSLTREKLTDGGRVVLNCIVLETLQEALACLENLHFADIEVIQVAVTRAEKVGSMRMMKALNPIFIIAAKKGEVD